MLDLTSVSEFHHFCRTASSSEDLGREFLRLMKLVGGKHYACNSNANPRQNLPGSVYLHDYPAEWAAHYVNEGLDLLDPVVKSAKTSAQPSLWTDPNWLRIWSAKELRVLDMASEFGLNVGISIPIHGITGISTTVSVAFDKEVPDPSSLHAIHLMALYLHQHLRRLKKADPEMLLSSQQKRCLELVALGKSTWTISKLLGISEATVKFHIGQAMDRLDTATRTQAVAKAVAIGAIRADSGFIIGEDQI